MIWQLSPTKGLLPLRGYTKEGPRGEILKDEETSNEIAYTKVVEDGQLLLLDGDDLLGLGHGQGRKLSLDSGDRGRGGGVRHGVVLYL